MFEPELRTEIANLTQVETKWGMPPEHSPFPYITLTMISSPREHYMKGRVPFSRATVQVDIWSNDLDAAFAVKNKLDYELPTSFSRTSLKRALIQSIRQSFDGAVWRYSMDIHVYYL